MDEDLTSITRGAAAVGRADQDRRRAARPRHRRRGARHRHHDGPHRRAAGGNRPSRRRRAGRHVPRHSAVVRLLQPLASNLEAARRPTRRTTACASRPACWRSTRATRRRSPSSSRAACCRTTCGRRSRDREVLSRPPVEAEAAAGGCGMTPKTRPSHHHQEERATRKHGHHGGAWKVAYADFVTAMMAFFLVMWLVNTSPQVRSPLRVLLPRPGRVRAHLGRRRRARRLDGRAWPASAERAGGGRESRVRGNSREHPPGTRKPAGLRDIRKTGRRCKYTARRSAHRDARRRPTQSFFDVGSANIRPEMVDVLRVIVENIQRLPNTIAIEGHTDGRPYGLHLPYSNSRCRPIAPTRRAAQSRPTAFRKPVSTHCTATGVHACGTRPTLSMPGTAGSPSWFATPERKDATRFA